MVTESNLGLAGGRTIHVYDTGAEDRDARLAVFWHHGTPNIGAPPEPLFPAAARLGIRWVSYDRPGHGGSTPCPGRDVASEAADAAAVADALGIGQFAVMGHSGGAPAAARRRSCGCTPTTATSRSSAPARPRWSRSGIGSARRADCEIRARGESL
jgi:alpha/beta hydrolase fold